MAESADPLKLLYVGGYSRSGSTLLGRVLGEPDGSVCVGETRFLWSRGLVDNVDCGCGAPFRSCGFWAAVGERAFGGWDRVDAERMIEVDRITNRLAALPFHWLGGLRPGLRSMIDEYAQELDRLYRSIAVVVGARTIVDTSKDPTFACMLMRMSGGDTRIVHLVRDSRAVAYSWTRRRRNISPVDGAEFMPTFSPIDTAVKWLAWNASFHAVAQASVPYLRLSYEQFAADPRGVLETLSAFAGEPLMPAGDELRESSVFAGEHHIFSGNPSRSETGWLQVRVDDEWQRGLPPRERRTVTALTWPLLAAYGYPLRHAAGVLPEES